MVHITFWMDLEWMMNESHYKWLKYWLAVIDSEVFLEELFVMKVCCERFILLLLYILYGENEWAFYFQNSTTSYEHLVPDAEKALFLRTLLSFWAPWQGGPTMAPSIKFWVNLTSVYMLLLYLSCLWENLKTCSCILRIFLWISVSMHY